MGAFNRLKNFEHRFSTLRSIPTILNYFDDSTEEERKRINDQIRTKYTEDLLSNMCTCSCGEIVGEFNKNVVCFTCRTPVQSPMEQNLEPILWMKAPEGVHKLINPTFWMMLEEKFTRSNYSIIRWLLDRDYRPVVRVPDVMQEVEALNLPRGINAFYENFDAIMDALFTIKGFRPKKGVIDPLQTVIKMYRDCLFTSYLPVPNRSLLVLEETHVSNYADPTVTGAVDAIRTMSGIDAVGNNYSVQDKESRTIQSICMFADYYDAFYRDKLAQKEGIFRKHIFGTRSHWSFRAVISSITTAHDYEELHVSWGIGVSVMRLHLINKLIRKHGMTPNQATGHLNDHACRYCPLLDMLFKELITECPYKGIPVVFQRNPSLERGSAQALFITKIKTDVMIPTVSLSILIVKGYNADFDGDQLNGTLCIDHMTTEELAALAPHKSTLDLNSPRNVATNLSMPKPVISTTANWLHDDKNQQQLPDGELAARIQHALLEVS